MAYHSSILAARTPWTVAEVWVIVNVYWAFTKYKSNYTTSAVFNPYNSLTRSVLLIFSLTWRKLRYRKVKKLTQQHMDYFPVNYNIFLPLYVKMNLDTKNLYSNSKLPLISN